MSNAFLCFKTSKNSLLGMFLGYFRENPTAYITQIITKWYYQEQVEFFEDTSGNTPVPLSTSKMVDFELEEEQQQDHLTQEYNEIIVTIVKATLNKII